MIPEGRIQQGEPLCAAQKLQKIGSKNSLTSKMRSYIEKCSVIWLRKNFRYHDYCYNILAKPVYKGKECNDGNCDGSESDFSALETFIISNVFENHQAVSTDKFIQCEARKWSQVPPQAENEVGK